LTKILKKLKFEKEKKFMVKKEVSQEIEQSSNPSNNQKTSERTTARMRTLIQAIAEIQKMDSDTAFTLTALRRKTRSGEIPSIMIGKKNLVNLDVVISYLNNPSSFIEKSSLKEINKIRKVI